MSYFDYTVTNRDGSTTDLRQYAGKVLLIVNTATGCGFTPQYDDLEAIYKKYGYYDSRVTSFALSGMDGLQKMGALMNDLREKVPSEFAGNRVLAVRDYLKGERVDTQGSVSALEQGKSNVLYYELEDGAWICVRPSGTEPKVKLYVNAMSASHEETDKQLQALSDAAVDCLNSLL